MLFEQGTTLLGDQYSSREKLFLSSSPHSVVLPEYIHWNTQLGEGAGDTKGESGEGHCQIQLTLNSNHKAMICAFEKIPKE